MGMGSDDADDAPLWAARPLGDGASFGLLWDRHRDAVFRLAVRFADSREDAEDAVALTFLEAWRLRARVRVVNGSVLPWLLVTCRNVTRNGRRSRRRYATFLSTLPPRPVAEVGDIVSDRERAWVALDALTPVERRLLTRTSIDGLDLREAGAEIGLSHSAARAKLSRAKARLRAIDLSHDATQEGTAS